MGRAHLRELPCKRIYQLLIFKSDYSNSIDQNARNFVLLKFALMKKKFRFVLSFGNAQGRSADLCEG